MKLKELYEKLKLKPIYVGDSEKDIKVAYTCDLLSEVMGKAEEGAIWVTVHNNMNVAAVASMLGLGAVVISEGHSVDEKFLEKMKSEEISLFYTDENSYTLSGRLYEQGIR